MFQTISHDGRAWRGTVIETAARTSLKTEDDIIEIDNLLPKGETGILIWIKEDVEETSGKIFEV